MADSPVGVLSPKKINKITTGVGWTGLDTVSHQMRTLDTGTRVEQPLLGTTIGSSSANTEKREDRLFVLLFYSIQTTYLLLRS